jgi:hypothetical protein
MDILSKEVDKMTEEKLNEDFARTVERDFELSAIQDKLAS